MLLLLLQLTIIGIIFVSTLAYCEVAWEWALV
jgi:hypothetical protein